MGSIGPIDLSAISRLSERWQRNISAMQYLGFREMWKWETNQADSLGSPGSVWGVPCASLLSNELSHTPYRKGKGEALALGKAEALAQRRELRTNQASYRKLHQSPRHWAPNHPMKMPNATLADPDTRLTCPDTLLAPDIENVGRLHLLLYFFAFFFQVGI